MIPGLNPEDLLDQGFNAEHRGLFWPSPLEDDLIQAVFDGFPAHGIERCFRNSHGQPCSSICRRLGLG